MTILNFPEDSILKRHFEANVEMKRQQWLQQPPTDSVLRRHAMSPDSHATTRSNAAAAKRTSPKPSTTASAPTPQKTNAEKGFFARILALFGAGR